MHKKLFIPGPIEVKKEILDEMSRPMIGHRSRDFMDMFSSTKEKLKRLFNTDNVVFISTSSGTGLWEAAARNCIEKRCLCLVNGAFSDRWHKVVLACGKEADKYEVELGQANKPDELEKRLMTGKYDAVTVVHNETSTGVMNPLDDIAEVMRKYPEVSFLVDAVSSLAGMKIEVDKLGIDVCLASSQKALGLPPGISVCSVSKKAFEKSRNIKGKGYYFDFEVLLKYYEKDQTPITPSISHIFALHKQLEHMEIEGYENRFRRHLDMATIVRTWAIENNFSLFAEKGYESNTVTCINNSRNIDVSGLCQKLEAKGYVISNGYGSLKGKTFRIAHMADIQKEELKELLSIMKEIIENENPDN
ncbi:MAG: alanine--glyoxylate aminotransferase family protein [Nanoarchaeota archaeon]|nr:alanine--glyoxylate aminotransferase family protein [Nanoarchaeota archaeon]